MELTPTKLSMKKYCLMCWLYNVPIYNCIIIILQSRFTPLMYISDMDHMEPLARTLLNYGADLEITAAKVEFSGHFLKILSIAILLLDPRMSGLH